MFSLLFANSIESAFICGTHLAFREALFQAVHVRILTFQLLRNTLSQTRAHVFILLLKTGGEKPSVIGKRILTRQVAKRFGAVSWGKKPANLLNKDVMRIKQLFQKVDQVLPPPPPLHKVLSAEQLNATWKPAELGKGNVGGFTSG